MQCMEKSCVPVAVFVYKRHANFPIIMKRVRKYAPARVYLIADGPKPGEEEMCDQARRELEKRIDWPCEIRRNYSDTNLGLKKRFSTGIDWVFEHEDRAIFIEDDCVPNISFFRFCEELLEKYKDDDRIASISGNNFLFGKMPIKESYYYSRYPLIWGWATWKRAWAGYDPELKSWETDGTNGWLKKYLQDWVPTLYWSLIFNLVKKNVIKTWDYQFTYHCFRHKRLHIIPAVNLVTNVGDDKNATNTKLKSKTIGLRSQEISFPLVHPASVARNKEADKITERNSFITPIIATSLVLKSVISNIRRRVYVR